MTPLRPLIVDDSVVVRSTLTRVFADVPEIGRCAVAANGQIAMDLIRQDRPDVVILDLEMPTLNGLDTLRALRRRDADLPVIIFSSLTESGARETIEALSIGATDYVTKPADQRSLSMTIKHIHRELVPRLLAICSCPAGLQDAVSTASAGGTVAGQAHSVLVIGCSTGGPIALETVLSRLPVNFPLPIAIAQHMPALFTARLADSLMRKCRIPVTEVTTTVRLRPGTAYIAAGTGNMIMCGRSPAVCCQPCRPSDECVITPSADILFQSAADTCGAGALALVLSGMGMDGRRGCKAIREAGGRVIVQDEQSSVVWGMPGAVAKAGLASDIVPLHDISGILETLASGQTVASV